MICVDFFSSESPLLRATGGDAFDAGDTITRDPPRYFLPSCAREGRQNFLLSVRPRCAISSAQAARPTHGRVLEGHRIARKKARRKKGRVGKLQSVAMTTVSTAEGIQSAQPAIYCEDSAGKRQKRRVMLKWFPLVYSCFICAEDSCTVQAKWRKTGQVIGQSLQLDAE